MINDELTRWHAMTWQDALPRRTDGPAPDVPPHPVRVERADLCLTPHLDGNDKHTRKIARRCLLGRLDARTRSILVGAAAAVVVVNAGVAWAYWHITESQTGRAKAGAVVELNLRGRSDLNEPLTPGSTGDLIVTVTNENDFPIRITSVSPGAGNVVADDEHRDSGCVHTGVVVSRSSVQVRWHVTRNNVAAYTVPGGLAMGTASDPACAGAVFTVPVLLSGVAGG